MWLIRNTEPGLWTVGHYEPTGEWYPHADFDDKDVAERKVHYLNGGEPAKHYTPHL